MAVAYWPIASQASSLAGVAAEKERASAGEALVVEWSFAGEAVGMAYLSDDGNFPDAPCAARTQNVVRKTDIDRRISLVYVRLPQ